MQRASDTCLRFPSPKSGLLYLRSQNIFLNWAPEFLFDVVPGAFSDARRNLDGGGGPVDAVATSFFLDYSHNPIDTVRGANQ